MGPLAAPASVPAWSRPFAASADEGLGLLGPGGSRDLVRDAGEVRGVSPGPHEAVAPRTVAMRRPGARLRRFVSTAGGASAKGIGLLGAAAVAAVTLRSFSASADDGAAVVRGAAQAKYMGRYMQAQAAGAEDPWAFQCECCKNHAWHGPYQAQDSWKQIGWNGNESWTERRSERDGKKRLLRERESWNNSATAKCCKSYRDKNMPYDFPQCGGGTVDPCKSCEKATAAEELRSRPPAALAGLAWAASVDVKGTAPSCVVDLEADIFYGSRGHISQMCPAINGWKAKVKQKFDPEGADIGCKVYHNRTMKIAIVAFRGVDFVNVLDLMTDTVIELETVETSSVRAPKLRIHKRLFKATNVVIPKIRSWVEGIPADTKLLFTGHGMGGALAIIASTLSHVQNWTREPDAIISFGSPRISDNSLQWYWATVPGWCDKMLRINVYNDMVPHMPLTHPWFSFAALAKCEHDARACIGADRVLDGMGDHPAFSAMWKATCPDSEVLIPGAMRGMNKEMEEYNPTGGVLVHTMQNCQFGYAYGVLKSLASMDGYCGLATADMMCPSQQCTTTKNLNSSRCIGLEQSTLTTEQAQDADAVAAICRRRCCDDMFCDVWQAMSDKTCWLGRREKVDCYEDDGSGVVAGEETI